MSTRAVRDDNTFKKFKSDSVRIAKQLFYTDSTISAIRKAKSESEIIRAMQSARQRGEKR